MQELRQSTKKQEVISFNQSTAGNPQKNAYNPKLYPEEVRYGDPLEDLNPLEQKLSQDIITKINNQIKENSHGRLFAVIRMNEKQFRVTPEDIIMLRGTYHLAEGEKIVLEKILAVGCSDFTLIGRPMLDRDLIRVDATVIEKSLSYPIIKYTHYKKIPLRRRRFFRDAETMIRINKISFNRLLNDVPNPDEVVHEIR